MEFIVQKEGRDKMNCNMLLAIHLHPPARFKLMWVRPVLRVVVYGRYTEIYDHSPRYPHVFDNHILSSNTINPIS